MYGSLGLGGDVGSTSLSRSSSLLNVKHWFICRQEKQKAQRKV